MMLLQFSLLRCVFAQFGLLSVCIINWNWTSETTSSHPSSLSDQKWQKYCYRINQINTIQMNNSIIQIKMLLLYSTDSWQTLQLTEFSCPSLLLNHKSHSLPPDRGEGQGDEDGADLRGVDWAEPGQLDGCGVGGAPNRSPSRSVVVLLAGGWGEDGGILAASPSRPRRSTSSDAGRGGAVACGSGLLAAFDFSLLALLCWLERDSISSSDGSLSSFGPTLPPQLLWPWAGSKGQNGEKV